MDEVRLVTELFLERPNFEEATKVANSLRESGMSVMLLPQEDRGINTHVIVESSDVGKVHNLLGKLGISAKEKEVVLVALENRPGTMANTTRKVSETGVNLTYVFSVAVNPQKSYVLFAGDDNQAVLNALKS